MHTLIATTAFGLEKVVKFELADLGFEIQKVSNGKVEFSAKLSDIPKANIWLRSADRVLLKMGEFEARTFDELFDQTKEIPWEKMIPKDGQFTVLGGSVNSELGSIRACQSIVKKSVSKRLCEAYKTDWLEESGAEYTIKVSMLKDVATLTIDTSGTALHKRGYRAQATDAPMKETLAAALVQLSFWNKDRLLLDPFCGSGTILIEAAMIAKNIAPGLKRHFASQDWDSVPKESWEKARTEAKAAIDTNSEFTIYGYDRHPKSIEVSKQNAKRAGVAEHIQFENKEFKELWFDQESGIIISNPPYGQRLAEFQELNQLYISIHQAFKKKKKWSLFILTGDRKFPDYFKRAKPDRVRKLYNGTIEVNYYQYFGER